MESVDTLFVLSSQRGAYAVSDLLAAIRWSCQQSHHTIVVNECARPMTLPAAASHTLIPTRAPRGACGGFHRAAGVLHAIEAGIAFRQAVLISDTSMILAKGVDSWSLKQVEAAYVGSLGVACTHDYEHAFRDAVPLMTAWRLPHGMWEKPVMVLQDDYLVLSEELTAQLFTGKWLVPDDCDAWPTGYGAFLSWVGHMLRLYTVGWGSAGKALPPLYVSDADVLQPPPHILNSQFIMYAPASRVLGYSELDLRELYKHVRGEPSRAVAAHKPAVSPTPGAPG